MAFGFFDWLRVRTRDAILIGASEAGRTLEQGTEALTERTEAVTTFDHQIEAPPPEAVRPGGPAALTASPPSGRRGPETKEAKGAMTRPHDRRPTSGNPKTQALLDARPGTDL